MKNRKEKAANVLFSLLAIVFLGFPIYSAFVKGILSWHISQPRLWRDGIELLLYFVVLLFLVTRKTNKKGIIVLVVSGIYLLSAGTLIECLVSYVYIEILLQIGRSCLTILSKDQKKYSAGVDFLVGSLIWGVGAITISLLGIGTIEDLRIYTIILFLLAIINPQDKSEIDDILLIKYIKYLNKNDKREIFVNLFFVIIMLIACARVNNYIDFDSAWYALYTDKCLFGNNSFYDYLGYADTVHYYPKFKELLFAPITGLGMEGYLIAPNLWVMLICVVEVYEFLKDNVKGSKIQILSIVYLIFSTPCILGISTTAKSDTISYLYMLLLIIYFIRYLQLKEQMLLGIAVSSGIMSYTVKYTSFLFSTLVFICIFIMIIYLLITKKMKIEKPNLAVVILTGFACFVFAGIIYRTFKITGYPTYRAGMETWQTLGFSGKPYFEKPYSVATTPQIGRIFSWFFDVDKTSKHCLWIGNYSLFFLVYCASLGKSKGKNTHKFMMITTIVLNAVSLYYLVTQRAPDGNYFSVAVIMTTCYGFIRIAGSKHWEEYKEWISIWVGTFMLLNLAFIFVTHPSWGTGTKFTEEPISMYISEEMKLERKDEDMKALGIYEINEELKNSTDGTDFIIADGINESGAPQVYMDKLDARVDTAGMIFYSLFSGAHIDNYSEFLEYIDYAGVDGFIISRDDSGYTVFSDYVKQYVAEYGYINQVDTNKYSYYKIK